MKKFLALIPAVAMAFTIGGCKKDEVGATDVISVSSVYKCVVWEYTATWCGPCGEYGYPAMHTLMHKYDDSLHKAVGLIIHVDDQIQDLDNLAGIADIEEFFGFGGTPDGAVNVGPSTYPTYLEPKVTQAISANPTAKAGVGMAYTIEGNTMTINTKTVFFQALTGSYSLAVYVAEDGIMNYQSGQTPAQVQHDYVLRAIAGGKAFGSTIVANPAAGTKIDGSYTVTIPQVRNKENLKVVCVIYKMDPATGEPTEVINSNSY
jgi:hypothetical protein